MSISLKRAYEVFQTAGSKTSAYTTNNLNFSAWGDKYSLKSVSPSSVRTIRDFVVKNGRFPDNLGKSFWAASRIEYDLFLSKIGAAKPLGTRNVTGYYVQLGLPAVMYQHECSIDWQGRRIAYIDWCDLYLIKSIMKGYRIPDDAVEVIEVPMNSWERLVGWMTSNEVDAIVAFVVPDSAFARLLQRQQLSIVGWKTLDMDRIGIFHPYIKKKEVDVKDLLTNGGTSSLMVMDREKTGPLLEMDYGLYPINGANPNIESFITRLEITPESLDPTYRCYGELSIEQKALCDSPFDAHGEPKVKPTIWDRPCVKNEDCPFYKANKNYNNTRGGCLRGGICEMPTGVLRTAFRQYHDKDVYAPFCYGCNGNDPQCCKKQDKPDYAFPNDYDARKRAGVATFVSAI